MKKICAALIVALCLYGHSVSAQTNVSGFINANTTWTLAGSPYIVIGNALLSQGFTLTIDPGVVVKFGTNNALQIDGQLIAIGTPSQRIVFTSNQANPQPGDWAKLHFSDFSTDAVYNAAGDYVSGTILKYCDVLYGGSLMWGSVDIQQCSPYINHCRIMNGSWCGINFNGVHLTMDSSRISNCPKRGIYYQGGHFIMRNDTFVSNLEGAIHVIQSYDGLQSHIVNSYFWLNYGAISWQNNGLHHLTIRSTIFLNNNGPAVVALQGECDTVICCRFRNNTNGPAVHWNDGANPFGSGLIHNNLIEYNTNSSGPSVFLIGVGGADTMFISDNTIRHNSSPGNSCCYIDHTLTGVTRSLQIYNNTFSENDGINFMQLLGPQTNDPSFDFMYMSGNTFINPLCQYELNNSIPYGSPNVFVSGNYWASSSTTFVDGRIYDYFDFANQSVVYYMPILSMPVATDTICHQFQPPVGVEEQNSVNADYLQLYPNPTSGNISLRFSDAVQSATAEVVITNVLSEVVYRVIVSTSGTASIPLPDDDGVYFISVTTKEGIRVERVVRQ